MKQRTRLTAAVLCLGAFMAGLDLFIVNIAFPDLARDFGGASIGGLSWVLNAYTIVFAALLVPAGRWADELGRKRVFLTGLALFTGASAACAAAGSVEVLVALRVVQATGAALLMPSSLALLIPLFAPEKRAMTVALWAMVGSVAAAAGPPLGGVLVQASWRWVFLVNVPIGIAAIVLGLRLLHEQRQPDAVAPDAVGAGLFALAIAALVGGIVQGPEWGWLDGRTLGLFVGAVVLAVLVARRSGRHAAPVIDAALLEVRAFRVAIGAAIVFYAGFSAMLLGGVLFLTGVWGEDVLTAGLMLAPGPAMAATFAIPGARVAARRGMATVGAFGAAVFALGTIWWLVRLGGTPHYVSDFLPGMLVTGLGVGCVLPTVTGAAAAALPANRLATGTAMVTTGRQVGSALGVAIAVALLATPAGAGSFDAVWGFIGAAAALSAVGLGSLGVVGPAPAAAPAAAVPEAAA